MLPLQGDVVKDLLGIFFVALEIFVDKFTGSIRIGEVARKCRFGIGAVGGLVEGPGGAEEGAEKEEGDLELHDERDTVYMKVGECLY